MFYHINKKLTKTVIIGPVTPMWNWLINNLFLKAKRMLFNEFVKVRIICAHGDNKII